MITQKKMIIPIFNYKLTVVIFDKWEELGRFLPKEEMEQEAKAITINQYGASLVAINSKRGSSIIHEAEHIKNSIWRDIGGYSLHLLQLLMCMLQSTLSTMTMQNCLRTGLVMV